MTATPRPAALPAVVLAQSYNGELLRLSPTDAEELVAVLQYLVRTAEQA